MGFEMLLTVLGNAEMSGIKLLFTKDRSIDALRRADLRLT